MIFRSWARLGLFSLMFLSCSALIQSEKVKALRKQLLNNVLSLCVILSIICFFCYFFEINLFEDRYYGGYLSDYNEFAGHFSGITRHSMLLGPIAGMAVIYLIDIFFRKRKVFIIIPLLICFASLLFSASRAALFATIGGIIFSFVSTRHSIKKSSRTIVFIIIVLVTTFPLYRPYLNFVFSKHYNIETGQFDSRTDKVEARLSEFRQSPIVGVGFSAIDPVGDDEYNSLTGTIEPGSSWLSILSMTGIIGLFLFLLFFIKGFRSAHSGGDFLLSGLIVFFTVHMLVEGYIFSSANTMSSLLWLTIGCCYDKDFKADSSVV